MKTGAVIKYLPNNATAKDIEKLRQEFASDDRKLILVVSGKEKILENLCDFIKSRKI